MYVGLSDARTPMPSLYTTFVIGICAREGNPGQTIFQTSSVHSAQTVLGASIHIVYLYSLQKLVMDLVIELATLFS